MLDINNYNFVGLPINGYVCDRCRENWAQMLNHQLICEVTILDDGLEVTYVSVIYKK